MMNSDLFLELFETSGNYLGQNFPLKFDDHDWFNGLGITIHGAYSTAIFLDYISISGNKFKASVSFQIQDHFDLDVGDVNGKGFEDSPWFCSWFILQRYKGYGYKPFINEANLNVIIEG